MSKTFPKKLTNVAYMQIIISLTGTPPNLEFLRKFLQCFHDIDFLWIMNKDQFSNKKENYFVADPAWYIVFMPNFVLFFKF